MEKYELDPVYIAYKKELARLNVPCLDPATSLCKGCGCPTNGSMCGWDLPKAEQFREEVKNG